MRRTLFVRYWVHTEPPWDRPDVPWLLRLAASWAVALVGFLAAGWAVRGIDIGGWEALLPAAAIFVVARAVLRPLLIFLTCPLQLLTLGLFVLVVNALILAVTAWLSGQLGIDFSVDGFAAAFLGALVVSGVSFLLQRLLRRSSIGP